MLTLLSLPPIISDHKRRSSLAGMSIQIVTTCAVVALSHRSITIPRKYRGRVTKGVNHKRLWP
ncbi:hypothetical protein KKG56_10955, partial [bacterium]|nr:hypothetical protein [bacterium]